MNKKEVRQATYVFEVTIDELGRIGVRHNCNNLVEFLGVLEFAKMVVIRNLQNEQSSTKEKTQKPKALQGIDPYKYLKEVMENTREIKSKGIIKSFPMGEDN